MRGVVALAMLTALTVAACGSSAQLARSPAPAGRVIELTMQTIAFEPNALTLKAGEHVTIRFLNRASGEHEFMAGRSAKPGAGGFQEDLLAGIKVDTKGSTAVMSAMPEMSHAGFGLRVSAGQTAEASFEVPLLAGTYEFGCFVPGHYEAGMKGVLVIN